jgi:hypothetical protein
MRKKIVGTITALTLATAGVLTYSPADAGPADKATAKKATKFAYVASGFGTMVRGGQVPAGSGTSAYEAFGCTNKAGITRRNFVANEPLGGGAEAEQVTTKLITRQKGGTTATTSTADVARVVLAESGLGQLRISAISSVAKAFHTAKGFDTKTETTVGRIVFDPAGPGAVQELPIPTPGQPVAIPGLATISIGDGAESKKANMARAVADGIKIQVIPSNSQIRIAHTRAKLERGVKTGLMNGQSMAVRSALLGGTVQLGKNPLSLMPCHGTNGKVRTKSIAHAPVQDGVELQGLTSRQFGVQEKNRARGFEFGKVNLATFEQGELTIENVTGKANVLRVLGKGVTSNIKGTDPGYIEFQGQEQSFDPGEKSIEIPGVAIITKNVVKRMKNGIHVIGLQVKLLQGSQVESIINLGEATMKIKRATL